MSKFSEDIVKFNNMYKLPVAELPNLYLVGSPIARLTAFKNILLEEIEEVEGAIGSIRMIDSDDDTLNALTELADLLGDIQVYCASEMAKFGIPIDKTLDIIMQSNLSKLGSDGNPIYDERGKVMKGPNYWKPEPKLKEMLTEELLA